MANEYVVDTHALVWYLEGNPRLGALAKAALDAPDSVLHLPVIALAEACWIVEKKRCAIPDVSTLLQDIDNDVRVIVVPMDRSILELSLTQTAILELHDRLIAATLLFLQSKGTSVSLLTRDANIKASGIAPIVW